MRRPRLSQAQELRQLREENGRLHDSQLKGEGDALLMLSVLYNYLDRKRGHVTVQLVNSVESDLRGFVVDDLQRRHLSRQIRTFGNPRISFWPFRQAHSSFQVEYDF